MNALRRALLGLLAAAALAAPSLCATEIVFVADTSDDRIYRLEDLDLNGAFNDPGEVTVFYDNAIGSLPMSKPNGVVVAPDGTVFVADADTDTVLALRDMDHDGTALGAGEARVFFDGTPGGNPAGIQMVSAFGLTLDDLGQVWVAASNLTSSGSIVGDDMILVLKDIDHDGNANGVGEARIFHSPALGSGGVGDSIPTAVKTGQDGAVYYAENGVTGVLAKAIWRLEDLDLSGAIDQPGEATVFFPIPTGASNVFLYDVEQGADGAWYVSDRGNEVLWRAFDANADEVIGAGEFTAWFTGTSPSDLWTVRFSSDGSVYGGETAAPCRIRRFSDDDGDGVIGAGEVTDLYDSSSAVTNISYPRCIAMQPIQSQAGTAFCFGDGGGTTCPCVNNNNGSMGGCDWGDPAFPGGGVLSGVGSDSLAANNTVLEATGVSNNFGIFFGANNQVNGGHGNPLNDGLRCAGGGLVRLIPPTMASGNQMTLPGPVQTLDTGAASGVTRRYQYWFRTPSGPCGQQANLTNGYEIAWLP